MWKLYISTCVFMLINAFENTDLAYQTKYRKILPDRKPVNFVETVKKTRYLVEEHLVTTEDGYVLTVHRMFGGPKSPPGPKKSLVLFVHGIASASDIWIMRGPEKDLVYLLVDEGFDVWMINLRGNSYSRRHVKISPSRPEFWQYTWHENGVYDVPATIDYMLARTGLAKVTLIGYSMGTTITYVSLCKRPEYNEKVDLVVSLAPIAIFTRQFRGSMVTFGLQISKKALSSLKRNGILEVLSYTHIISQLALELCSRRGTKEICHDMFFRSFGIAGREQFDDSFLPSLLMHYPAGTSLNTLEHYRQNVVSESFREFDYGEDGNYARYGSSIPPEYPLWRVTAPVILYHGLNDPYVRPSDVEALKKKLPNVVASKVVTQRLFNHIDFVVSKNAKELLYNDVIDSVKKYKAKESRKY